MANDAPAHRWPILLDLPNEEVVRIDFRDGQSFRLRCFGQVEDPVDGWTAEVVQALQPDDATLRRFFYPGSGMVFSEGDVTSIFREQTGEILV